MNETNHLLTLHGLLLAQNSFNSRFPGWQTGVLDNGKVVDWLRYIRKESNEATERLPFKHWAKITDTVTEIDINQIRMEVVDIFHFLLSQCISFMEQNSINWKEYVVFEQVMIDHDHNSYNFMALEILFNVKFESDIVALLERITENHGYYDVVRNFELLEAATYSGNLNGFEYFDEFVNIMHSLNMDFDLLTKLYYGKNALNKFRNDNGYKEGTYIKNWNGVDEDNDFLQDILDQMHQHELESVTAIDMIYIKLQIKYNEIINIA